MSTYQYNFEKLEVWNLAINLSVNMYRVTGAFPSEEKFGLISQIRRASNSVSANIAEGMARKGNKERARFIQIAFGSAVEVLSHLILAQKLEFITKEDLEIIRPQISELTNKLNAFHNSINR